MKRWTYLAIGFVVQLAGVAVVTGQVVTHGPVVGGVTSSGTKIFTRLDNTASIQVRYGTDPALQSYSTSSTLKPKLKSDFTGITTLSSLTPDTTYYLNPVVNGVPQLSTPYPSFKTFPAQGSVRDFSFVVL